MTSIKSIYHVATIAEADALTAVQVAEQLDVTNALRWHEEMKPGPPRNGAEPYRWTQPAVGDWKVNPRTWEPAVFLWVPVASFEPSEADWDFALRLPSTRRYVEWARAGLVPPPLNLVRTCKGNLRSTNRRRWLAAREAAVHLLPVWYAGPCHAEHVTRGRWWLEGAVNELQSIA